jgi:aryl-alcohol dehydrogenase-like predicted oxidoreductase
VALAWCLADPALDRVVVGPRSTTQLASVPRAAKLAAHPDMRACHALT